MHGVENTAEVDERCEYKGGNKIYAVDRLGVDTVHKACERKNERREHSKAENDERVENRNMQPREEHGDHKHKYTHQHPAHDTSTDESRDHEPRWGGRDEYFIDRAHEEL